MTRLDHERLLNYYWNSQETATTNEVHVEPPDRTVTFSYPMFEYVYSNLASRGTLVRDEDILFRID